MAPKRVTSVDQESCSKAVGGTDYTDMNCHALIVNQSGNSLAVGMSRAACCTTAVTLVIQTREKCSNPVHADNRNPYILFKTCLLTK